MSPLLWVGLIGGGIYLMTRSKDTTSNDPASRRNKSWEEYIGNPERYKLIGQALQKIETMGFELKRAGKTVQEIIAAEAKGHESMIANGIWTRDEYNYYLSSFTRR